MSNSFGPDAAAMYGPAQHPQDPDADERAYYAGADRDGPDAALPRFARYAPATSEASLAIGADDGRAVAVSD